MALYSKNSKIAHNLLVGSRLNDYELKIISQAANNELARKGYISIEVNPEPLALHLDYNHSKGLMVNEDYLPDVLSELERQDFNIRQFGFTKFMATVPKRSYYM